MSKLITVIGATGTQGGSVVAAALKSGDYKVRGVTRNVDSEASRALVSKGVEMVAADLNDQSSLEKAFEVGFQRTSCEGRVGSLRLGILGNFWCDRFLGKLRHAERG